jgi:hypothetical protein
VTVNSFSQGPAGLPLTVAEYNQKTGFVANSIMDTLSYLPGKAALFSALPKEAR